MAHSISNIIDLTNAPTPPRWFEFLLEPGRLQQHLEMNSCDPSPIELITLFFRNIPTIESNVNHSSPNQKNTTTIQTNSTLTNPPPATTNGNSTSSPSGSSNELQEKSTEKSKDEPKVASEMTEKLIVDFIPSSADGNTGAEVHIPPDSYEAKYRAKKAYALQTLAIKVASFVDWDLNLICNNLTIPTQYKLMQSLNLACSSDNCPLEVKKFSNVIYWHWFLKTAISYQLSVLQPQSNNTTIIYLSQLQQQQQAAESSALFSMGELFTPKSKQLKACSTQLHSYIWELSHNKDNSPKKIKGSYHPFKKAKLSAPLMDCFDSTDDQFNDWTKCQPIESRAFIEAACFDLGKFFFFEESYKLAKETFEIIKDSASEFPKLLDYLGSSTCMLKLDEEDKKSLANQKNGSAKDDSGDYMNCDLVNDGKKRTEKYLFDCMTEFRKSQKKEDVIDDEGGELNNDLIPGQDSDLRIEQQNNAWYAQLPATIQQQQAFEAAKGGAFMSQGDFKQAMGCFVGSLMLMTDYFRIFSKGYTEEEPYISRMIQCSISLSCFTQAVALCQMTKNINYTMAFKQLNERVCNDCCDDIYECIWNVTLLEYIINLHSKRGEVERRTNVIQLIGQLELNENNPEEILREAEHVRRGKFFRIMSNKYL